MTTEKILEVNRLQIKKDLLHERNKDHIRHLETIRVCIDFFHTERVRTEDQIKDNLDKAQKLAEQIDEIYYKESKQ